MNEQEKIKTMLTKARLALDNAYAPYSNFKVGVCLRTVDDQLFIGCNNENAAYPLCQCAEATAIGNMVTMSGANNITDILIIATSDKPCTPCGGCRQRIREFAQADTMVHSFNYDADKQLSMRFSDLLPESFGPEFLQR